jgi:hypothetical protein
MSLCSNLWPFCIKLLSGGDEFCSRQGLSWLADEIDAIGTKRYESQSGGEREIQRTMLELLNQMDGFDSMGDVKVWFKFSSAMSIKAAVKCLEACYVVCMRCLVGDVSVPPEYPGVYKESHVCLL